MPTRAKVYQQKKQQIGVLFVHGIGEQNRGDTLMGFGEPLFRWLCKWLTRGAQEQSAPDLKLSQTSLNRSLEGARYSPAATCLSIRSDSASAQDAYQITWVMAESWWAQDFTPPASGELAKWAIGIGPWMVWRQVDHLIDRYRRSWNALIRPDQAELRAERDLRTITNPLLSMVLTGINWFEQKIGVRWIRNTLDLPIRIVTFIFLILRALLQLALGFVVIFMVQLISLILLIPSWIPLLNRFVQSVQRLLATSIGDSYILVTSPLRFNAMISQVQNDLRWLKQQQCDSIVVIAHSQGAAVAYEALKHSSETPVALFITFGSGISKLKAVQSILPHERQLRKHGLLNSFGVALCLIGLLRLVQEVSPITIAYLAGVNAYVAISLVLLGLACIGLAMRTIGKTTQASFTAHDLEIRTVGAAGGMAWHDYYASSDPVPDGPLPNNTLANVSSEPVHNQASWLGDHSLYWQNWEQFVPDVALLLSQQSGWRWSNHERSLILRAADRRVPRVAGLMLARSICFVSVFIAASQWVNPWLRIIGDQLRLAIGAIAAWLPGWVLEAVQSLPSTANYQLGRLVMILLVMVWYWAIRRAWFAWDRKEAQLMFQREESAQQVGAVQPSTHFSRWAATPFFIIATLPPLLGSLVWLLYAQAQGWTISTLLAGLSLVLMIGGVAFGWIVLDLRPTTTSDADQAQMPAHPGAPVSSTRPPAS